MLSSRTFHFPLIYLGMEATPSMDTTTMPEKIRESPSPSMSSDAHNVEKPEMMRPEEGMDDEAKNHPHGLKLFVVCASLCLAVFLVALVSIQTGSPNPRV